MIVGLAVAGKLSCPLLSFWKSPTFYLAQGKFRASSENGFSGKQREILAQMKQRKPQEYFVYFKVDGAHSWGKRAAGWRKTDFSD